MPGLFADALGGGLQIEEGAAATGAGNKFCFGDSGSGSLEDVVGELDARLKILLGFHADEVSESVTEEGSGEDAAFEEAAEETEIVLDAAGYGVAYPDREGEVLCFEGFGEQAVGSDGVVVGITVSSSTEGDDCVAALECRGTFSDVLGCEGEEWSCLVALAGLEELC